MAYVEERELEEVIVENAVSSFRTVLGACFKPEIDYDDLAEKVDVEALATKVSCESIAEHICCETVAGYVKYDAVVEMVKEELPQIEDLDVLQGRLNEMWEFYMSFKTYFSSNAAAPVNADGELK